MFNKKSNVVILVILVFLLALFVFYGYSRSRNVGKTGRIKEEKIINNFEQLNVDEFKKNLESGDYILIDVRTPEELPLYGKISDRQLLIDINDSNFSTKIMRLGKMNKYLVYCWHGNRSQVARDFMEGYGFGYVKDLQGGIDAWITEGEDIIK